MPRIDIPQTGTTIDWPPAAAGRVRINATLHLSDQPLKPGKTGISIELSFKRDPFRRLFKRSEFWRNLPSLMGKSQTQWPYTDKELRELVTEEELDALTSMTSAYEFNQLTFMQSLPPDQLLRRWGQHIAGTLHDSMAKPDDPQFTFSTVPTLKVGSRKWWQIMEGYFQGIEYRLKLDRDELRELHAVIATETGARRLPFEVYWFLLPTALLDYALRGLPRGNKDAHLRQNLMVVAQCAVFVAEEMVKRATDDQALRSRIQPLLVSEETGWNVRESIRVLTLANRALRPALKRYKMKSLEERRDISDILDPTTRASLAELFKAFPERLLWWWDLLLAEEGQAARTLQLIP